MRLRDFEDAIIALNDDLGGKAKVEIAEILLNDKRQMTSSRGHIIIQGERFLAKWDKHGNCQTNVLHPEIYSVRHETTMG